MPRSLAIAYSGKTMEVPVQEKAKHVAEIYEQYHEFTNQKLPYINDHVRDLN